MTYRDEFETFLRNMVDKNGYPFTAGFTTSLFLRVFESLPKKKQKELVEMYLKDTKI